MLNIITCLSYLPICSFSTAKYIQKIIHAHIQMRKLMAKNTITSSHTSNFQSNPMYILI